MRRVREEKELTFPFLLATNSSFEVLFFFEEILIDWRDDYSRNLVSVVKNNDEKRNKTNLNSHQTKQDCHKKPQETQWPTGCF